MKKQSKKTIHRLTRHQGIRSARRKANRLKEIWLSLHKKVYWCVKKFKKKNRLTPRQQGRPAHIDEVSTKISVMNTNLNIVKQHGYVPRKTKKEKEIVVRMYDGYTCKERRLIARSLAREYKLIA
jgi:hypothetical protein